LLPADAEKDFAAFGIEFCQATDLARRAITLLRWSQSTLGETRQAIHKVVTASGDGDTRSLLGALSVGKAAAAAVEPLKDVQRELRSASGKREDITCKETEHAVLEELADPLNALKAAKKYAESEVARVFTDIRDDTISNWKTMYRDTTSGLSPARLVVGSGHDKSVTAFLSKGEYEVPEKFFGNAGLQRAVALSFYFALLEKHPRDLGFAIMDDPVLSLDDGHRERWSREILRPWMKHIQFIVATHQEQFLLNCRNDFLAGNVYELNERPWMRPVSWKPGTRLKRVEEDLESSPSNTPNQMRMYCEELLATLETYAHKPFVCQQLFSSIPAYAALPATDPLATEKRTEILAVLNDNRVTSVVNAGSHHGTQANVTIAMCRDCHAELLKANRHFQTELARLEKEHSHSRRKIIISTTVVAFAGLPREATRNDPIELCVIGRAAAREESWVVDDTGELGVTSIASGGAVLVTSDVLNPVARPGQWALLADEDVACNAGDLVAARCADGSHLLRRVWSDGDSWTLQSVNSVRPIISVAAPKVNSAIRKVVGVLYEEHRTPGSSTGPATIEWQPRGDFREDWISKLVCVRVEGGSLDPIARAGQHVLIDKEPTTDHRKVTNGDLAVVDTKVDSIGRVIKRVYHRESHCILIRPNPVDPHPPEILDEAQLASAEFFVVRGVLFESND